MVHSEYRIIVMKDRIEKIEAEMEALKENVEAMTSSTPLAEVESANAKWTELSSKKRWAARDVEYQEGLLVRLKMNQTPFSFKQTKSVPSYSS